MQKKKERNGEAETSSIGMLTIEIFTAFENNNKLNILLNNLYQI